MGSRLRLLAFAFLLPCISFSFLPPSPANILSSGRRRGFCCVRSAGKADDDGSGSDESIFVSSGSEGSESSPSNIVQSTGGMGGMSRDSSLMARISMGSGYNYSNYNKNSMSSSMSSSSSSIRSNSSSSNNNINNNNNSTHQPHFCSSLEGDAWESSYSFPGGCEEPLYVSPVLHEYVVKRRNTREVRRRKEERREKKREKKRKKTNEKEDGLIGM